MRFILPALAGLAMVSCFTVPAMAAPEEFILEKPHTQIYFAIDHMGFTKSYGRFIDYSGTINLDQQEPEKTTVDVTIKTASIDMGDEKWDTHLKSPDFFNVEKFPDMTFKSTKVEKTGDKTANLTGDLTILGVTKPVTLAVTLNKTGKHPMAPRIEAGFSATGTIKRSDFGMNGGVPMVGDEVTLMIEVDSYKEDKTAGGVENQ